MMNKALLILLLFLGGCYRVPRDIEPKVTYAVQEQYLKQLPSPFAPLSSTEKETDWGKEYTIGLGMARQLDLYRAITAFRRAEILLPDTEQKRKLEIAYEILLCYYLGRRFEEVDYAFTHSPLSRVSTNFPAFHDLLVILYDTYRELDYEEKTCHILEMIHTHYLETYDRLIISAALIQADLPTLREQASQNPSVETLLSCYDKEKKSIGKAQAFNALLPGAGYFYIGQKQTAITALLINGLFIAASAHFFLKGEIAAGLITTSFEAGWYFGGIYGAGYEAKFYNERLYEKCAYPIMSRNGCYPIFTLHYAF